MENKTKSIDRKTEIIQIATELLIEKGADKMSLREVARRVGISAPSCYEYFKSKDDLMYAIHMNSRAKLFNYLQSALEKENPNKDKLQIIMLAYIQFAKENPKLYDHTYAKFQSKVTEVNSQFDNDSPYKILYTECDRLIASKETNPSVKSSTQLAFQVWSTLHGMVNLRNTYLSHMTEEIDEQISLIVGQYMLQLK